MTQNGLVRLPKMSESRIIEQRLVKALLYQDFSMQDIQNDELDIQDYELLAKSYTQIENNIVVLSDYKLNQSQIYSGDFGSRFGIDTGDTKILSAFEDGLFANVEPKDLMERHALELSFLQIIKNISPAERPKYFSYCKLRMKDIQGNYILVNHRMQYLKSHPNGNIWLSMCIYSPSMDKLTDNGIDGKILNSGTGEVQTLTEYSSAGKAILSKREIQVLEQLGKGCTSKQISYDLKLALNTIYRHRQNILQKLNVYNSSQAVQVGTILGLLK